jgi:hypothetical protein
MSDDDAVKVCSETINDGCRIDKVFFSCLDKVDCPSIWLRLTVEKFWGLQIAKLIPDLDRIYAELVKQGATKESVISYSDDEAFFLPCDTKKVFSHTGQTFRFLYIWDKDQTPGFRRLHIRRYYDIYNSSEDEWTEKQEKEFKKKVAKKGYKQAIIESESITEEWADDYQDNLYPYRYSLKHYIENGFKVKYGDVRDKGYIATWEEFAVNEVQGAMEHHYELNLITTIFIPFIVRELVK